MEIAPNQKTQVEAPEISKNVKLSQGEPYKWFPENNNFSEAIGGCRMALGAQVNDGRLTEHQLMAITGSSGPG